MRCMRPRIFAIVVQASPFVSLRAVEQKWSNGPVEGHINRLKTLKRQMYGRAGFELLRARVLPLPPPASLHQK